MNYRDQRLLQEAYSNLYREGYDWRVEIERFHDKAKNKQAPDLVDNMLLTKLQSMPLINAYKAVQVKNKFDPRLTPDNKAAEGFISHFGSLTQARMRMEIMEEDDWYIFRYTISLDGLYPRLLMDPDVDSVYNGGPGNNANIIRTARESGYTVLAYRNTAEGNVNVKDNLSLIVCNPLAIL